MKKIFSIILFIIIICFSLKAQTDTVENPTSVFTIEELQKDFQELRSIYENEHDYLYEYTSKQDFDSLFDHQYSLITKPMEYHEFFQILAPINNHIGCMHTNVWMPGKFWDLGRDKLFPLQIKFIEGYAVVTGYFNDTAQVPIGSIILDINRRSIISIINNLKKSYSSDGLIKQFKLAQVEKRFPMALARYYGFSENYEVTYALPGMKTFESKILVPANITDVRKIVFENFNYPPLALQIHSEINTAVLKVPSFIFYDRVEYFKSFIDSAFSEIKSKKITNLVLDLRGNDGGDPFCSVPLFSYLEKIEVPYFAEVYGRYSDFAEPIPLAENHFTGNLFTLIDKHCGSTNGHFCSLIRYHNLGKIIGEEGGATYKCNAKTKEIRLTNTNMILLIPQGNFAAAVKDMDKMKGVMPDFFVEQTYRDFLSNNDTVMNFTIDLIKNK